MSWTVRCLLAGLLFVVTSASVARDFDYQLRAEPLAPGVFVVAGVAEDLSRSNGGNILNTGFIVGSEGIAVIDAGPSRLYGEQFRALISKHSDKPILQVLITHHHPDHFFGLQAFQDVPTASLTQTIAELHVHAAGYSDNMYRLIGNAMLGTDIVLPQNIIKQDELSLGDRTLQLLKLSGHTSSDLAVYDPESGTLFAGDLIFNQRAPTTPHADIARWQQSLDTLQQLPFRHLVPGHGPVADNDTPLRQTRDYLVWLQDQLSTAAADGLSMAEVMFLPIDPRFADMAVIEDEYHRSVTHLFGDLEATLLNPVGSD